MPNVQRSTLDCDVLVIGSGAAGLACAVTAAEHGLDVVVAEKASHLGGTSAWSGGWMWIPRNPLAIAEGVIEDEHAAERYLLAQTHQSTLNVLQRAYLKHGPKMVDFFQSCTDVQFYSGTQMPDMHAGEGSANGSRSLCAQPFDGRLLGQQLKRMRAPLDIVSLFGMGIAGGADMAAFFNSRQAPSAALHVLKRLSRHAYQHLRYGQGQHLVNGNALVARLLSSALKRKVRLLTDCPVHELIERDQRICGALAQHGETPVQINARHGVVLACGGFPHDPQRIALLMKHAPNGTEHFSAAPQENSGDGLRLAQAVGAQIANDLPHAAAWAPVSHVPRKNGSTGNFPHLIDRAKPGFIAVRRDGKRFVNEAQCYHDFMHALFNATPEGETVEAWLICDSHARWKYGIGWAKPLPFSDTYYQRCGYLKRAANAAELAASCEIDAHTFKDTLARFNADALTGHDRDFQRGESAYNRAQGDAQNRPNPSLRPLEGTLYAVKLHPGSLGTFAGIRTDVNASVLNQQDNPIAGLYAVGNDMNSVMGGYYPSGGITLGPAMTFGYLAALHIATLATSHPPKQ